MKRKQYPDECPVFEFNGQNFTGEHFIGWPSLAYIDDKDAELSGEIGYGYLYIGTGTEIYDTTTVNVVKPLTKAARDVLRVVRGK